VGRHRAQGNGQRSGGQIVVMITTALLSATVVTATMGFAFWAVAAHLTSAEVVGRSAAVISAMQLIAAFATLGLHQLLVAELPGRGGPDMRRLVLTCLTIGGTVAFAAAAAYAFIHDVAAPERILESPLGVGLFGIGTAVTTVATVVDGAAVGVGQSGLQVSRNLVFSIVRLIALPLAAFAIGLSPQVIFLVWMLGNVVSLLILTLRTQAPRKWLTTMPALRGFAPIWRTAAGHHWVNVATETPRLALPVMVAAQVSAEANAGFYIALLLVAFIWLIPNHLGTAMFALHSGDPQHFSAGLNTAIRLSAVVSIGAAVFVPLFAGPVLSFFGPGYDDARYFLSILAACTFASAVKSIYISVRRAQGALSQAAWAAVGGAVLELAGAQLGLMLGGVTGIGIGAGAATILEAAFFLPAILKARREGGQPTCAYSSTTADTPS
jgi:O-antigen/teichoic acid export membrane protein